MALDIANYDPAVSAGAKIGYSRGGSSVTQTTNRATGVTINALSGTITTDSTSLAAEASAVFVVTNNTVAIGYVVVCSIRSGAVALNTEVLYQLPLQVHSVLQLLTETLQLVQQKQVQSLLTSQLLRQ